MSLSSKSSLAAFINTHPTTFTFPHLFTQGTHATSAAYYPGLSYLGFDLDDVDSQVRGGLAS